MQGGAQKQNDPRADRKQRLKAVLKAMAAAARLVEGRRQ